MPTDEGRPAVIPSPVDPDIECVRVDPPGPTGEVASPPDASPAPDDEHPPLCPEGYVPRRRRRTDYRLDGKLLVGDEPPERNPADRDD
jgi:hypothetical protein